jgi:hypothetical protein
MHVQIVYVVQRSVMPLYVFWSNQSPCIRGYEPHFPFLWHVFCLSSKCHELLDAFCNGCSPVLINSAGMLSIPGGLSFFSAVMVTYHFLLPW